MGCGFLLLGCNFEVMSRLYQGHFKVKSEWDVNYSFAVFTVSDGS